MLELVASWLFMRSRAGNIGASSNRRPSMELARKNEPDSFKLLELTLQSASLPQGTVDGSDAGARFLSGVPSGSPTVRRPGEGWLGLSFDPAPAAAGWPLPRGQQF